MKYTISTYITFNNKLCSILYPTLYIDIGTTLNTNSIIPVNDSYNTINIIVCNNKFMALTDIFFCAL